MDQTAFDRISALFAAKAGRRNALAGAAGAAALAAMPEADAKPAKGKPGAAKRKKPKQEEKTMFLFLQTSQGGTLSDNGDGTFDLVLEGHHGGTIYFSDRPQRVFGVSPTDDFLETLGFPVDNPPNAALLVDAGDTEDVAIVELFDPAYDEGTGRLTYKVKILAAYDENGLDHVANQITDAELPTAFDQATLFIDDCSDLSECCKEQLGGAWFPSCEALPDGYAMARGKCFNWSHMRCEMCDGDGAQNRWIYACQDRYGQEYNMVR